MILGMLDIMNPKLYVEVTKIISGGTEWVTRIRRESEDSVPDTKELMSVSVFDLNILFDRN